MELTIQVSAGKAAYLRTLGTFRCSRCLIGLTAEPAAELGFQNFIASLIAKAIAVAKSKK